MTIDEQTVRKVAQLARLELSEAEVASMTDELQSIVDYVDQLQEVDIAAVATTRSGNAPATALRDDVEGPVLPVDDVLANGALTNQEAFLVPRAVER